eukprot:3113324-Rhodomonas_salina.3
MVIAGLHLELRDELLAHVQQTLLRPGPRPVQRVKYRVGHKQYNASVPLHEGEKNTCVQQDTRGVVPGKAIVQYQHVRRMIAAA